MKEATPSDVTDADDRSMDRWLWVTFPLAYLGVSSGWGGLGIIIARQVGQIVPDAQRAAAIFGSIAAIGAVMGLFAQPVLGGLSDRTPARWIGRRNLWALGSGIVSAAVLVVIAANHSLILLGVLYALVIWPLGGLQAAVTTVIPERVPLRLQGRMSAISGSAALLGILAGVTVAGYAPTNAAGYLGLAAIILSTSALFAMTTREPTPTRPPAERRGLASILGDLPGLSAHRDFWLAFASRFAIVLAYGLVTGFNLFLLKDYVGIGDIDRASREVAKVMAVSSAMMLLFSIVGGIVCDTLGRVRAVVVAASLIFLPASAVLLLVPTLAGYTIGLAIIGAGFGMYIAVDQVLIARVLPDPDQAARDLGILNVANSGPQVVAPAIAGAVVAGTGLYTPLFVLMAIAAALAATAAHLIRSVR